MNEYGKGLKWQSILKTTIFSGGKEQAMKRKSLMMNVLVAIAVFGFLAV
jgi:hypothetical protein